MEFKHVTIAVIFHSGNGHTQKLAEAIAEGVDGVENSSSLLLNVEEAPTKWDR